MGIYGVALAVALLPLAGLAVSYLAETRRGVANAVVASSWLALVAALILLVAVVGSGRVVHSETITFWAFQIVQSPFNAAVTTQLAETFSVGLGYAATPTAAVLAVLITLVTLLCELQMMIQYRRDPRLGQLVRLGNLVSFGALLVVLAPELFQVLVGFEVCGLAAAQLVASTAGQRAGSSARSGYLIWRLGGLSLLLAVAFIYVKFSGAIATAAAAAVAAAGKHKAALPTPDGLNLVALSHIWAAATKGLVPGVGGRTLTLAAVLLLVAAGCACGQLPAHGLWRSLGSAPGAAAALVLSLAGMVVGADLLLQTFPLLRLASGVLPALVVLATLSSLVAAVLAFREHRLRRLAVWVAASQTGWALAGIGLGSPAAAVALLASSVLATAALVGVVTSLGRDQRVDSIDQLGAAWKMARPTVMVLLAALAAACGLLGVGTFFGHAAVMGAALGAAGPQSPAVPALFRGVAAAGEVLAMLVLAAACARVALIAIRGQESADPREARLVRRQLAQGRGWQPLWPSAALAGLALASGLVSLPGIRFGIGGLLGPRPGVTSLPVQAWALLAALVVPLAAGAAMAARRSHLAKAAAHDPTWLPWADGTQLAISADSVGVGLPARALGVLESRALTPAGDAAAAGLSDLVRWDPATAAKRLTWSVAGSLGALAVVALTVALVIWAATGHGAGPGLP